MKETVLGLNKDMKFYFCPEYVNMQKGIDSLCGFIRSNLMRDPFSNEVFIWRKRSIPTHLERHNPPTIIAKMGLKRA